MTLAQATAEAKHQSIAYRCVQHVNRVGNYFVVSDWYDGDATVASFENGKEL